MTDILNMIYPIFDSIPDHRVTGRCIYHLGELLTISLLTYMSGGEDYVDMSLFAKAKARRFGLLSDCEDHSPSPDTFERVMSAVCPDELERCLVCYGRSFLDSLKEKQVVIDGKKLRGASPKSRGTHGDYILNAYASENHIMIGQVPLKDKENEIVAIPKLLDKLDIEGAVVSMDAIGTQTGIARMILDKKADYFLAVKDNQGALHSEVIDTFRYYRPFDESSEMEADHGRIEMRRCRVLHAEDMEDEQTRRRWPGIQTLVEITSEVTEGDGPATTTVRHYISSESFPHASYYAMLARGHWGIENQLHWHLDVTFKEDASRARKGFAPQNLSMIRKIALQAVKAHPDKRSVRKRLFLASLDEDYLMDLVKNVKF